MANTARGGDVVFIEFRKRIDGRKGMRAKTDLRVIGCFWWPVPPAG